MSRRTFHSFQFNSAPSAAGAEADDEDDPAFAVHGDMGYGDACGFGGPGAVHFLEEIPGGGGDHGGDREQEAELEGGGAVEADDLAGVALGVAQVVQPSDNLELPFGSTAPSSKRALAALTALSSASSSLTRRRAVSSGSAS